MEASLWASLNSILKTSSSRKRLRLIEKYLIGNTAKVDREEIESFPSVD